MGGYTMQTKQSEMQTFPFSSLCFQSVSKEFKIFTMIFQEFVTRLYS